jgi:hypothetical protein
VPAGANRTVHKSNEYCSDGISAELLNVLAKVPGLKVSVRTSAFCFKGKEVPIPEIAKQLVAYVVEGIYVLRQTGHAEEAAEPFSGLTEDTRPEACKPLGCSVRRK